MSKESTPIMADKVIPAGEPLQIGSQPEFAKIPQLSFTIRKPFTAYSQIVNALDSLNSLDFGKNGWRSIHSAATLNRVTEVEQELLKLQTQIQDLLLKNEQSEDLNQQYARQLKRVNILRSVGVAAQERILESDDIAKLFEQDQCDSFVVSIDIRKSTDLMLKATEPKKFAEFITRVCDLLKNVIFMNHGVFDKFTGDGILAFFPKFYSGIDAGMLALLAAEQCHAVFRKTYREYRSCFTTVRTDAGLGIGIDYGQVALVSVGDTLTVVGKPVVYACRLGAAPAGMTYINQQAQSELVKNFAAYYTFAEHEVDFKNEGSFLAYCVQTNGQPFTPKDPPWLTENASAKANRTAETPVT